MSQSSVEKAINSATTRARRPSSKLMSPAPVPTVSKTVNNRRTTPTTTVAPPATRGESPLTVAINEMSSTLNATVGVIPRTPIAAGLPLIPLTNSASQQAAGLIATLSAPPVVSISNNASTVASTPSAAVNFVINTESQQIPIPDILVENNALERHASVPVETPLLADRVVNNPGRRTGHVGVILNELLNGATIVTELPSRPIFSGLPYRTVVSVQYQLLALAGNEMFTCGSTFKEEGKATFMQNMYRKLCSFYVRGKLNHLLPNRIEDITLCDLAYTARAPKELLTGDQILRRWDQIGAQCSKFEL